MSKTSDQARQECSQPPKPTGYHSRSERRSTRREAQRRRTVGHLLWVAAPIMAGVVVIVALFAFVVTPSEGEGAGSSSATTSSASLGRQGSGLLVVEQSGTVVEAALVYSGAGGGLVLAIPGTTLLRSGERFATVAQLFASDQRTALAGSLADAVEVPLGAVASAGWGDLRDFLADAGIDPLPPVELDPTGADAAEVAAALAAMLRASGSGAGESLWNGLALRGEAAGFREAVGAALAAVQGGGWTGRALPGSLRQEGVGTYLEPDLAGVRSILGTTGEEAP